jgi:hypothetical protein
MAKVTAYYGTAASCTKYSLRGFAKHQSVKEGAMGYLLGFALAILTAAGGPPAQASMKKLTPIKNPTSQKASTLSQRRLISHRKTSRSPEQPPRCGSTPAHAKGTPEFCRATPQPQSQWQCPSST